MALAARLGALLAVAFAAGGAHTVHGYGLSLTIPSGWDGKITHGLVRLDGPGLRVEIRETSEPTTRSDPFFRRSGVPTLRVSDFRSREHHLGFTLAGRRFALLPLSGHPSQQTIDATNAALRTFVVKRGTYYGQPLAPARFPQAHGWFVGAKGGTLFAEGGQTETWAATVPYLDAPLQIPPNRTLSRLQPNGVIVWVSLSRDSALSPESLNALRIRRDRVESNFEGLPSGAGLYRAVVPRPSYSINLWVFFKTAHPAAGVVARAQAQVDRLRLPRWPRG